ncbi:MAG: GNAT family N-acetyltransferase, partial [Bacteroidales bacterium]|nr:GNAT family N-acetyltransferase [Bacteroidales bacterium]
MTNKEKYRLLCQNNSDINIFMQDWWLDALCGDSWDVLLKEQNNKIIATLPYFIQKKYGFKT